MTRPRLLLVLTVAGLLFMGCSQELPQALPTPDFTIAGKKVSSDFLGVPSEAGPVHFYAEVEIDARVGLKDENEGRSQRVWHIEDHEFTDYTGELTYTFQKEGMIEVRMCKGDDCVRKYVYVIDPTPEPVIEEPVLIVKTSPKKKIPPPKPEPAVEPQPVEEVADEVIEQPAKELEVVTDTLATDTFDANAPLSRRGEAGVLISDLSVLPDDNCTSWTSKAEITFETSARAVLRELVVYSDGPGQIRLTWKDASDVWSETMTAGLIQGWSQISLSDLYAELNIPYIKYTLTLEIIGGSAQIADVSSCSDIDFGGINLPVRMEGNAALFNLKIDY